MSPRRGRKAGLALLRPGGQGRDLATEQAIDALDYLRAEMRRSGLLECADILDDAFVRCLRVYVNWKCEALAFSGPKGRPDKQLS